MPTILNQEQAIRAMAEAFNFDLTPYEEEITGPQPVVFGPPAGAQRIPEVDAWADSLPSDRDRVVLGGLGKKGEGTYWVFDEAYEEATGAVKDALFDLRNYRYGMFNLAESPWDHVPGAIHMELGANWNSEPPNVRVFPPGVKRADVLPYAKKFYEGNRDRHARPEDVD